MTPNAQIRKMRREAAQLFAKSQAAFSQGRNEEAIKLLEKADQVGAKANAIEEQQKEITFKRTYKERPAKIHHPYRG